MLLRYLLLLLPVLAHSTQNEYEFYVPISDIHLIAEKVQCYPGTLLGIPMMITVGCGHPHLLKFTPEEVDMGYFNFFDHIGELMPRDEGYIGFLHPIHGINTTLDEFVDISQRMYDAIPEKPPLVGVYFPLKWLGAELFRIHEEMLGKITERILIEKHFIESFTEFINTYHEGNYMLTFAHSEGALVAARAINLLTDESKKFVKETYLSIAIGPAEPLHKELVKKAIDFYSDKDFVALPFAKPYLNDPNYDIRIVTCISKWSERSFYFADHSIFGSTYQEAYMKALEELREERYEFYDGQDR